MFTMRTLRVLKLFKNRIADDCVPHFASLPGDLESKRKKERKVRLKSCRELREVHLSHNELSAPVFF